MDRFLDCRVGGDEILRSLLQTESSVLNYPDHKFPPQFNVIKIAFSRKYSKKEISCQEYFDVFVGSLRPGSAINTPY